MTGVREYLKHFTDEATNEVTMPYRADAASNAKPVFDSPEKAAAFEKLIEGFVNFTPAFPRCVNEDRHARRRWSVAEADGRSAKSEK